MGVTKQKVDAEPVHQLVSKRFSCTWSLALEFSNCNIKCHQGNSDNGPRKKRVKGRGGGEKWGLKSTMANKSHQMTMPDSHFNSEMMLLSCLAPKYWFFFFSTLRAPEGKKNNLIQLKQIPAAGISPLLVAIKVNAGATLIKVSLLLPAPPLTLSVADL